jgi:pentatricopeptide repeat protein
MASVDRQSIPVSVAPDATTFAMFIDYFAHLHEFPRCWAIFEHLLATGIPPTPRALASLMRAYFLAGHGGAAVRLLAAMCNPETTLPELFSNVPSPDGHVLPFDASGFGPPTRQIFNCFLRAVLRTNGLPAARTVLRLMQANDVKPDSKTSEIIASHVAKVRRPQPRMLIRMIRRFSPRFTLQEAHIVLSSTMRFQKFLVHGIGWNVTAAKFSRTRTASAKPFPTEFVSGLAPNFDPMAGIALPRRMRHRGTFRAMEQSLADRGIKSDKATIALRIRHESVINSDMDTATEVFRTLLSRGLHPNQYHYSALMEGFANSGDFESALEVMRSAARASFEPNVLMFTILIVGYARRKQPEMALRIFRRMVAAGIKPDVPAIDAVASAFFFIGAYDMCRRVLTSLWQHISPLPPGLDQSSLRSAVVYFRSLHQGRQEGSEKTSKDFRTSLYRELRLLSLEWRYWQRLHSRPSRMPRLLSRKAPIKSSDKRGAS